MQAAPWEGDKKGDPDQGANGVYLSDPENTIERIIEGFSVRAVDTTAAGDVFNGALAVALSKGEGILEYVRFANAAAAISVGRIGAQPSIPFQGEISQFLELHP